ncbi:MAG: hypothetical protein Q7R66_02165 [Undibacterium sp.]|uniref:hypothetical protein n=1 Tax=Undibacterium sp. TaxID=1914977 RepID=UPI00272108D3|nr:hypothetical protein [Undibacterium sp.]MDO8650976.1 hypothetical protein [Undibacterium sp.]
MAFYDVLVNNEEVDELAEDEEEDQQAIGKWLVPSRASSKWRLAGTGTGREFVCGMGLRLEAKHRS